MTTKKYNFVVFGSNGDFYTIPYREINTAQNAKYICKKLDTDNRLLNFLHRIHCSQTTKKYIDLPGQSIWNRWYYRTSFKDNRPICFIFFHSYLWRLKHGYVEYLRKTYPGCKIVAFFQDLVAKENSIEIEELKEKFDAVISFDQQDAQKYGFIYYPLVYTPEEYPLDNLPERSDVYFVGKAKDRLEDILTAYRTLRESGCQCDFHIVDAPIEKRKYADEIDYCPQMPYVDNLRHIKSANCLLEIMQGGGHGYTLRTCEAIVYGKKLMTNNPEIKNAPFYRPELISVFEECNDIDAEFACRGETTVDYHWKEKLSPIALLDFIENYFNSEDCN